MGWPGRAGDRRASLDFPMPLKNKVWLQCIERVTEPLGGAEERAMFWGELLEKGRTPQVVWGCSVFELVLAEECASVTASVGRLWPPGERGVEGFA